MKKIIQTFMAIAILLISLNIQAAPNKATLAKADFYNTAVVKVSPATIDVGVVSDVFTTLQAPNKMSPQQVNDATGYNTHPTKKADIIKWQKENDINADGNWGPLCKAKFAEIKAKKDASGNFNNSSGSNLKNVSNTNTTCGKNSVNNDTGQTNNNLVNTQLSVADTMVPDVVQLK